MPVRDRKDLQQIATVPDNLKQPVRFGGITELVKDAFVLELRHFFNTQYNGIRTGELPRVDKYSVALDISVDPLESAVNLVRSYPDITEDLPLIAVLATTGQNLKLGLSNKFTSVTIPAAKVVSNNSGPYALTDGMTLIVTTQPDGVETNVKTSTYTFRSYMFTNISQATLDEVIYAINFQALYATAFRAQFGSMTTLGLRAGGVSGTSFPNKITVTGGTAMAALGFALNQADQNYGPGKQAYERFHIAANLTIGLEVVTESENVRTEITDLLYDFVTFVMADRMFQFYGRSTFDETVLDETYQIIIKDSEISLTGEQETPRLNDPRDKLYINRVNIPVTAIQYTDRIIVDQSGQVLTPAISVGLLSRDDLPEPS